MEEDKRVSWAAPPSSGFPERGFRRRRQVCRDRISEILANRCVFRALEAGAMDKTRGHPFKNHIFLVLTMLI